MLARFLIFHVASGQAFFTGAGCLIAAIALGAAGRASSRARRAARNGLVLAGLAAVAVSSAGLEWWVYGVLAVATAAGIAAPRLRRRRPGRTTAAVALFAAAAWLGAVAMEAPYHIAPALPPSSSPLLLGIIADSITAGMNQPRIVTWPRLLATRHGVDVRDHSRPGATTATALKDQAPSVAPEEDVIWIELGGNDMLSGVPASRFAANLDRLLRGLRRPGRTLVMMELPLIPADHAYGLAQRRLARRYRVILIPRRVLASILIRPGATQDTVHLSQAGHDRMAEVVWGFLGPGTRDDRRTETSGPTIERATDGVE